MEPILRFHALSEADLPLLHEWLTRPHVSEWWHSVPSYEEVREDYLPLLMPPDLRPLDAPAGVAVYLAYESGVPIGYVQAYRVMAHQAEGWWLDEHDPNALGIDQFLAHANRLGQGLGTRMIKAFVAFLFDDPRVTRIQTDPDPENQRAVACYRKVGFHSVGQVETPDGPALLMRLGRDDWRPALGGES